MITTVTEAAIIMEQYLLKSIKTIIRDGSRDLTIPKTELSLAKGSHFELLTVATKKSEPGVGGILDATLIYSVQKSWNMLIHCPVHYV